MLYVRYTLLSLLNMIDFTKLKFNIRSYSLYQTSEHTLVTINTVTYVYPCMLATNTYINNWFGFDKLSTAFEQSVAA